MKSKFPFKLCMRSIARRMADAGARALAAEGAKGREARLFDIGVNLCAKQFKGMHEELKTHSLEGGLSGWITISNSQREWAPNLDLCRRLTDESFKVYCTIGVHPHNAKDAQGEETFAALEEALRNPCVVAVGECGLDYNRMFSPKEKQIEVFRRQIEIAAASGKPLYLHDRDSHDDFLAILRDARARFPHLKGVVHCFTGTSEMMQSYVDLGFYIGITGWLCDDRRNADLVRAVETLPLDRLLLETDAPYLTPKEYAKRWKVHTNQPDAVAYVSDRLARTLRIDEQELVKVAAKNAKDLFGIDV